MPRMPLVALSTVAALTLVLGATTPANAATTPKYAITAALATSATPNVGDTVKLSGTTSKKLKGESVNVDRKVGSGKWIKATTAKVSAKGVLSTSIRAASAGAVSYRFSIPSTKKHKSSTSNSASTTVYAYYYLSDLDMVDPHPPRYYANQVTIAGKTYYHSLRMYTNGYYPDFAEYNMSYRCKSFSVNVGIDDASDSASTNHDEILADGAKIGEADLGVGKSTSLQYDMTGVFRLRITAEAPKKSTLSTWAAWGDARVLCAGKP